jgi:hypothetical protein
VTERQLSQRERGRSKIVRMAEVERMYPNEWILLEITRDARDCRRVAGRLLAHSPDRSALDEPYERFRTAHPQGRVLEVFTGEIVPEDVVLIL